MPPRRIVIIQGHPDPRGDRFCHALARAYADAARAAGHELRFIDVATLDFPLLRTKEDWESGATPPGLRQAQADVLWANHLLVIFPLWLGTLPALLKGFFEQVLRPTIAVEGQKFPRLLTGRSARLVVTMGMPALFFRWFYGAHGVRGLERNVLGYCGIKPIRESLIGSIEGSTRHRERWLARMAALGRAGR